MVIKLIIGLRNPGAIYEQTRHNAGEWFVKALMQHYYSAAFENSVFKIDKKLIGEIAVIKTNNLDAKAFLPSNFMNHSGQSARAVSRFYDIHPNEILVVHDDLSLMPGRMQVKTGGGHGGHNGVRDIITQLGSADFHRLRIGIGHPGHRDLVHDYVLGKPSENDRKLIVEAFEVGLLAIPKILEGDLAKAMNLINRGC